MSIASIGTGPDRRKATMNTAISERSAGDLVAKAAIACAVAAGALFVPDCSEGVPPVVSQAFAAPVTSEAAYFPTLFPAPEGAPAEPIQGF